jgi:hypothetical protein
MIAKPNTFAGPLRLLSIQVDEPQSWPLSSIAMPNATFHAYLAFYQRHCNESGHRAEIAFLKWRL